MKNITDLPAAVTSALDLGQLNRGFIYPRPRRRLIDIKRRAQSAKRAMQALGLNRSQNG